jgi:hypothetical protein
MRRAALVVLLGLSACSSGFSDELRQQFLAGCIQGSGGNQQGCGCILEELEEVITEEELTELNAQPSEVVQADPRIQAAVAACS